jgi:hypothetical protein
MRLARQRILFPLLAPALYLSLTGQDVYVGEPWKPESLESLRVAKRGDMSQTGIMISVCSDFALGQLSSDFAIKSFIDTGTAESTVVTATPKDDESDVRWAVTTAAKATSLVHVELLTAESATAKQVDKVWKQIEDCAKLE